MSVKHEFTREELEFYLKELGKEFRKRNGRRTPAEMILVGGASVLINYGFREMTTDIDAVIQASSAMKESIYAVGDKYQLPDDWLNTDFTRTGSYSTKLVQYSKYYRTFSNILEVRTIRGEYLIAMKLRSGRLYKKDMSDIVGVVMAQKKSGEPITYDAVERAVIDLYGGWDEIEDYARETLKSALNAEDIEEIFLAQQQEEVQNKTIILEIQERNPAILKENSIRDIIEMAKEKQGKK